MNKTLYCIVFLLIGLSFINGQDSSYPQIDTESYGVNNGIGMSLFGLGKVSLGVDFKRITQNRNQMTLNASYFGNSILEPPENVIDYPLFNSKWSPFKHGVSLTGGFNWLIDSRYNHLKKKIIKQYLGIKVIAGYLENPFSGVVLVWRREVFKSKNPSFSRGFDLGIRRILPFSNTNIIMLEPISIFIKLDWNWFKN